MSFFGGPPRPAPEPQSSPELLEKPSEDLPELPEPRQSTLIAKDITIAGSLHGEGVVQIEGTVEGEVKLKGYVIVAATGVVRGPVEADVIRVAGTVVGDITSHDHLQLERSGTIDGDITTVSFVIEEGGRLNGRTTMVPQREQSSPHVDISEELQFGRNYPGEEGPLA